MCDQWMRSLTLPLGPDELRRLPRNGSYHYAHYRGAVWINPRPRFLHGRLTLADAPAVRGPGPRLLRESDWDRLPVLFASAFAGVEPFRALEDGERLDAARACLAQTRFGGDGPLVPQASFVAAHYNGDLLGAVLITLLPPLREGEEPQWHWGEPVPAEAVSRRYGRPHLTWVLVEPPHGRRGLGTTLLQAAAGQLRALGFTTLDSTFLLGNDASTLWHWRNGFRLLHTPDRRPLPLNP